MKICTPYILLTLTLLLLLALNSCSFSSRKSQRLYDESQNEIYDIIIVPGVPFEGEKWSAIMKIRVYWSKHLYDKGIAKNIMYSGSAVYSPYYEAKIMALYAEALGIPKENIYTEIKAEHSTENVYYSNKKARKLGFKKIALATDPFQSKMVSSFIIKKIDEEISLIPIIYDTLKSIKPAMIDPIINYKEAFNENFKSIKERESLWKRLNGTRGKNIDKTAYN